MMIHKFHDTPARLNASANIDVLIDEAHRTTGGDLGIFPGAGNAPQERRRWVPPARSRAQRLDLPHQA